MEDGNGLNVVLAVPHAEPDQHLLVVTAGLAIDPLREGLPVRLPECPADRRHLVLRDAERVDQQLVARAQALHGAQERVGPDLGCGPHEGAERILVVAARVALDGLEEVLREELLVPLAERVLLEVREVQEQRDEAGVVGAPACNAEFTEWASWSVGCRMAPIICI